MAKAKRAKAKRAKATTAKTETRGPESTVSVSQSELLRVQQGRAVSVHRSAR